MSKRCASTSGTVVRVRRANSAGCGVSTAGRPASSSASGSSVAGEIVERVGIEHDGAAPVREQAIHQRPRRAACGPRPGPTATASAQPPISRAASSGVAGHAAVSAAGSARRTASSDGASAITFTSPAPARSAARAARITAPDMPSAPPTIATLRRVPLWASAWITGTCAATHGSSTSSGASSAIAA